MTANEAELLDPTAIEEIEAAIKKLTAERDQVGIAGWERVDGLRGDNWDGIDYAYIVEDSADGATITEAIPAENAALIVTLHRTIEAQRDFLIAARGFYGARITGPEIATLFAEHALILARAINAGSHPGGGLIEEPSDGLMFDAIRKARATWGTDNPRFPVDFLPAFPHEAVVAKMNDMVDRGAIVYGASLRTSWIRADGCPIFPANGAVE